MALTVAPLAAVAAAADEAIGVSSDTLFPASSSDTDDAAVAVLAETKASSKGMKSAKGAPVAAAAAVPIALTSAAPPSLTAVPTVAPPAAVAAAADEADTPSLFAAAADDAETPSSYAAAADESETPSSFDTDPDDALSKRNAVQAKMTTKYAWAARAKTAMAPSPQFSYSDESAFSPPSDSEDSSSPLAKRTKPGGTKKAPPKKALPKNAKKAPPAKKAKKNTEKVCLLTL